MELALKTWILLIIVLVIAKPTSSSPLPQLNFLSPLLGGNPQPTRGFRPSTPANSNGGLLPFLSSNKPKPSDRNTLHEQKEKLEDLLERLKEKQKELEGRSTTERTPTTTRFVDLSTTRPEDFITKRPIDVVTTRPVVVVTTTEKYKERERVWKKITKKKMLMQVQPVVPENEIPPGRVQVLYYLEE